MRTTDCPPSPLPSLPPKPCDVGFRSLHMSPIRQYGVVFTDTGIREYGGHNTDPNTGQSDLGFKFISMFKNPPTLGVWKIVTAKRPTSAEWPNSASAALNRTLLSFSPGSACL